MNIAGRLPIISGRKVDPQAIAELAAAIPLDRPQVGEGGAFAQNEHRVLRAWQEFNRLFERAEGYRGSLVQDFDGLDGRSAGAAGHQSDEQNDRNSRNEHGSDYTGRELEPIMSCRLHAIILSMSVPTAGFLGNFLCLALSIASCMAAPLRTPPPKEAARRPLGVVTKAEPSRYCNNASS